VRARARLGSARLARLCARWPQSSFVCVPLCPCGACQHQRRPCALPRLSAVLSAAQCPRPRPPSLPPTAAAAARCRRSLLLAAVSTSAVPFAWPLAAVTGGQLLSACHPATLGLCRHSRRGFAQIFPPIFCCCCPLFSLAGAWLCLLAPHACPLDYERDLYRLNIFTLQPLFSIIHHLLVFEKTDNAVPPLSYGGLHLFGGDLTFCDRIWHHEFELKRIRLR
jgi:hypothetical protein